eukprot:TRINITY_DN4462_c0_g1_i1.p1 TRINITY_DN4462_c0_g1~~TRINITY_DN4462_c0_g1_i1.p1  ORF type:complete len:448 (+),score=159.05 TRINITY_DN4462_c0_g1_i1:78-1421(+)
MAQMTKEAILQCVKEYDLWTKPDFNEQLYLQCKGFTKITEEIGEYYNVRALWLQQNALSKIENLEKLEELGCLFVHQNCITRMTGFQHLKHLHTLNISNNYITKIEGLAGIPLETLQISHNRLTHVDDLQGLAECPTISTLDLSHNTICVDKEKGEKSEDLITVLQKMPELKCLYVQGNEITGQTRYWRLKVVGNLPQLTHMDERPVFEKERRAVNAWMVGGFEAEQAEREKMRQEEKAAKKEELRRWKEMQERGREQKEKRERELKAREEEQAEWRKEMGLLHSRARRECENDFMDVRAELWKEETQIRKVAFVDEPEQREKARRAQTYREEREAAEREAQADIAREEQEEERRRCEFAAQLETQKLSLAQEMQFLVQESELLNAREQERAEAAVREIEQQAVEGPAAPASHADPAAAPRPRKAGVGAKQRVWEQYAMWERKTRRL